LANWTLVDILFKLATAAVDKPDEVVRRALFPVVGETTLRELVADRPVMDAMKLLKKYADVDGKTRFYDADAGDDVPIDGVVRKDWRGRSTTTRAGSSAFPLSCVFWSRSGTPYGAARSTSRAPRAGAIRRTTCPATSRPPAPRRAPRRDPAAADPAGFIADLKKRMTAGLDQLSGGLADGSAGGVKVTTRKGEPWITVPRWPSPPAWRPSRRRSRAAGVSSSCTSTPCWAAGPGRTGMGEAAE
jgi:hypothetical protein